MCPQLKTFVCHETQEVLCLHDYQARAAPVRYKAKRNGLPAVIQITPVNDINHNTDLSPMMLCSGVAENTLDQLISSTDNVMNVINNILIEKDGENILYRSRNCQQLSESNQCSDCSELSSQRLELENLGYDVQMSSSAHDDSNSDDYMNKDDEDLLKLEVDEEQTNECPKESVVIGFKKVDEPKYECPECGKKIKSEFLFFKHLEEMHDLDYLQARRIKLKPISKDKEFDCPTCHRSLKTMKAFERHMKKHEGVKIYSWQKERKRLKVQPGRRGGPLRRGEKLFYKCDFCDLRFQYKIKELNYHLLKEHRAEVEKVSSSGSVFKCTNEGCFYFFEENNLLETHLKHCIPKHEKEKRVAEKVYDEEKMHQCEFCDKRFRWRLKELSPHIVLDHRDMLEKQSVTGKIFDCNLCYKYFQTEDKLIAHRRTAHNKKNEFTSSQRKEGRVVKTAKCPLCDEMFNENSINLVHHINMKHFENIELEEVQQILLQFRKCKFCGEEFSTFLKLNQHLLANHPESATASCHLCGKSFLCISSLRAHFRSEHKPKLEEQHICNDCGKTYVTKDKLQKHIRAVHKAEEIQCQDCGKVFKSQSQIMRHKIDHHMPKQFQCELCFKQFSTDFKLQKHINDVHSKLRPYFCEICGTSVASFSNLNLHRRKSHNVPWIGKPALKELIESGKHPYCDSIPEGFYIVTK